MQMKKLITHGKLTVISLFLLTKVDIDIWKWVELRAKRKIIWRRI